MCLTFTERAWEAGFLRSGQQERMTSFVDLRIFHANLKIYHQGKLRLVCLKSRLPGVFLPHTAGWTGRCTNSKETCQWMMKPQKKQRYTVSFLVPARAPHSVYSDNILACTCEASPPPTLSTFHVASSKTYSRLNQESVTYLNCFSDLIRIFHLQQAILKYCLYTNSHSE